MSKKVNFHIVTLFPESISGYIEHSILKRAIDDKKISVKFYDPKDFEKNKKIRVDDKPYGGGPGMVIRALPVIKAIAKAIGKKKKVKMIFLTPQGNQFSNEYADKVASDFSDVVIISGRYEGIDARVKEVFNPDEISVGPFVLTGGELPSMIIVDTIARRIPGILGNFDSVEEGRNASNDVYTRPESFVFKKKKYTVPEVLLSGNHAEIEKWRSKKSKKPLSGK